MIYKKIIGWILIIIGLVLISWTLYSSYNIFTAKKSAPEFFKIVEKEPVLTDKKVAPTSQEEIQNEMKKIIDEQIKSIIPQKVLFDFFNLISWTILAGILIYGAGKISAIGINLLKESR